MTMRVLNQKEFEVNLGKFGVETEELAMQVVRKLALDIFAGVNRKTPVVSGLLRNSWIMGVNATPTKIGRAGGGPATPKDLSGIKAGDTVIIVNNVEYAPYVEDGTDRMSPRLMLQRSIEEALRTLGAL